MFTLFFRAMLLYSVMILVIRLLGKRQLGEFQPYELALTILLADIISDPVSDVSVPVAYGLLPVAAVMVLNGVISIVSMKSDKIRAVISGKPTLVISRGVIRRRELERLCLSLSDLLEGLRGAGYLDPAEVDTAIVEANGSISAFPVAASRPVNISDLNLPEQNEGLPLPLIMDGRVQPHNLRQTGKDPAWLQSLLARHGLGAKAVYLATLDTGGMLTLRLADGKALRVQALNPGEVCW